jgi:magnesium-protoporphyrin O-methyltransferase
MLLDGIRESGIDIGQSTLLDVGGGIGAIPFELFSDGLKHAVNIDASIPYQQVARREAEERNLLHQTEYHYGDASELAPRLQDTDIVTLDRVICCYPEPEKLIPATASKSRRVYGVVYPKVRYLTNFVFWAGNLWFRLRGIAFRTYLFPPEYINSLIRKQGFTLFKQQQTFLWHVATYIRE